MLHIDAGRINDLLSRAAGARPGRIDAILAKSRSRGRLSLEETAALLAAPDIEKIYAAAAAVKESIYGKRVVLFAPLYISNVCANACLYCSFKSDNPLIKRTTLTPEEIGREVRVLLGQGHKRILMVCGEPPAGSRAVDYYCEAVRAIYSAHAGENRIRRVNVNCAPLAVEEFRALKAAGIGTYQLFQETYHERTYRLVHPAGPKSDPDNRIDAVDRAFRAGIDDVGMGVLYGLYDWRFETLALLAHIEHLEKEFGVGPHTISVPRIEPAEGAALSRHVPQPVGDDDFKKLVAVLRLSVPYTGIILSTREPPSLRDALFGLGVSQISAASSTSPGGYAGARGDPPGGQFSVGDRRSLDEVIASLIARGFVPSFCAACYRTQRTGSAFMSLAKPGTIKEKCQVNAIVTFKEYLDDFASPGVRRSGYALLQQLQAGLSQDELRVVRHFFAGIERGERDAYV